MQNGIGDAMSDIQININRMTEVHGHMEKARHALAALAPPVIPEGSGSPALSAFAHRVTDLVEVVRTLTERIEADSRALYHVSLGFMAEDDVLARTYQSKVGSSLGVDGPKGALTGGFTGERR